MNTEFVEQVEKILRRLCRELHIFAACRVSETYQSRVERLSVQVIGIF